MSSPTPPMLPPPPTSLAPTDLSEHGKVVEAYGRRAEEYHALLGDIAGAAGADIQRVTAWAKAVDGPILDLGCGPGRWTAHLADRGHDVLGVDPTPEFLTIARRTHPGVPFAAGSIENPGVPDFSHGGVLAWYSLIHLEPAAVPDALRAIRRTLRRGGRLLLGLFDGPDGEAFEHQVIAAVTWSVDGMTRLLEDAGFTVVASERRTDDGARPHLAIEAIAATASESEIEALLAMLPPDGVLALGEPTHGSGNAFTWKMDVILALAERGVLSTFAIEDSRAVGLLVDRALRADAMEGEDPSADRAALDDAWAQGLSLWNVPEIREGIHRLRAHNRPVAPERRVRMVGVDVQKPHLAARALLDAGHGTALLADLAERRLPQGEAVARLEQECARLEEVATAAGDEDSAGHARHLLRYVDAYLSAPGLANLPRRDTSMAQHLIEQLPARGLTVLWAHNEHVARNEDNHGGPAMGHVLARALGDRYVPIGMLCGPGTANAVDPSAQDEEYRAVPLPPIPADSTEALLARRGEGLHPTADLPHPGPRRFIGWLIDSSLVEDSPGDAGSKAGDPSGVGELSDEAAAVFLVRRPASDFAAIRFHARSVAAGTPPPRRHRSIAPSAPAPDLTSEPGRKDLRDTVPRLSGSASREPR
ncbi:erythromycin esterase family protein [Brachybacterium sp. DNPG3]